MALCTEDLEWANKNVDFMRHLKLSDCEKC